MANKRVTDLVVLTTPTTNDVLPIVDVLDTTQDPTGSLKQITWASLKTAILAFFSAGTGILISGGVISSDPTATQILTNKTLTSPTINTPTITSPALTVGSDATGDIYYRSSGGAFSRLPIGSTNQVLGVNSGLPAWATPTTNLYQNYLVDSGTANTYVITPSPTISAYAAGQVFLFKANNANTGASTLNVNSLGAKTILKNTGSALITGDIKAGSLVMVGYDGTNMQLLSAIATGPLYSTGITTRFSNAASGTQTIAHGLGIIPKHIRIDAQSYNGSSIGNVVSAGTFDGTTNNCIYAGGVGAGGTSGNSTTQVVFLTYSTTGPVQQVAVATFDATNITLTWTLSGNPTANNIQILWQAYA